MEPASLVYVLLLAAAGGGSSNDLVSCIDPTHYFESRRVRLRVPEMLALVYMKPQTGSKARIQQLLAIRWLGDHPAEARKDDKVRPMLEAIAKGKWTPDDQGFAKEYAARALARIDGKEPPAPRPVPVDSLRSEAFSWFPQGKVGDSVLAAGVDLRTSGKMKGSVAEGLYGLLVTDAGREEFYKSVESSGNDRLDRLAGFVQWKNKEVWNVLVRFTGAFDHMRLVASLRPENEEVKVTRVKGPKGEPITIIAGYSLFPITLAVVGDSDIVVRVGPHADEKKPLAELESVLAVRAGKEESALKGPLGGFLKETPDQAIVLAAAVLPKEVREQVGKESRLPVPRSFIIKATRDKSIRVSARFTLSDADEAREFGKAFGKQIDEGREWLKTEGARVKAPKKAVDLLDKTLADAKVKAKADELALDVVLSAEFLQAVRTLLELRQKK